MSTEETKEMPEGEVQEQNSEVTEGAATVEQKPTSFQLIIDVNKQEDQSWIAEMKDGDKTWSGSNLTPLDSVRTMLNNIEIDNLQTSEEKVRRFMQLNFDNAKSLVLQLIDILGEASRDWFTVYQLVVKTGMKKEELMERIVMLQSFGLLEPDRKQGAPGQRWKIVKTKEVQKQLLVDKKEAYQKEMELLDFQLNKLLLNEQQPDTTQPGE